MTRLPPLPWASTRAAVNGNAETLFVRFVDGVQAFLQLVLRRRFHVFDRHVEDHESRFVDPSAANGVFSQ